MEKLFNYLINNTKYYDDILNTCIIDSLILLSINYFPLVFDYINYIDNGIVKIESLLSKSQQSYIRKQILNQGYQSANLPSFLNRRMPAGTPPLNAYGQPYASPDTWRTVREMLNPDLRGIRIGKEIHGRIKALERVISAMDKPEVLSQKNFTLRQIFIEHTDEAKLELKNLKKECNLRFMFNLD